MPSLCEKCDKHHPVSWVHPGETRCIYCGVGKPRSAYRDRHARVCNDCLPAFEARMNTPQEVASSGSVFERADGKLS